MEKLKSPLAVFVIIFSCLFHLPFNLGGQFAQAQKVNTADFWMCQSRQGGSWTVGRAANICLVSPFQKPAEVKSYWSQVTYDDSKYSSSSTAKKRENTRYSNEMNGLMTGIATKYLKKRLPAASDEETTAWADAILAVSYHESIWTHYRKGTDGQMRMLRGDFGHGHGLMQVDDRWHFSYVKGGGAARLQDNIIYGLDLFYSLWTKAGRASCVGGAGNYLARTRATYSMYNGGEGSVCRWKNTSHRWYKNDRNFWDHYKIKGWKKHLTNANTFDYNFSCLVQDGGLQCFDSTVSPLPPVVVPTPPVGTPSDGFNLSVENLYEVKSKNLSCTWNNSFLSCLPSNLGTQCLVDLFGIDSDKKLIDLESETDKDVATRMINPETKCFPSGEVTIGDFILTQANINLRKTPGGERITTVSENSTYQVLDIYRNERTKILYYLISSSNGTGYIYTGNENNKSRYTKKSYSNSAKLFIANQDDIIEVSAASGINMRSTPGGSLQLTVPGSERLVVLSRVFRGEDKHVYYRVEYKGEKGFIYSGRLAPTPNVTNWTKVK